MVTASKVAGSDGIARLADAIDDEIAEVEGRARAKNLVGDERAEDRELTSEPRQTQSDPGKP